MNAFALQNLLYYIIGGIRDFSALLARWTQISDNSQRRWKRYLDV